MTDKISPLIPEQEDIIYDGLPTNPTLFVFKAIYEGNISVAVKVFIVRPAKREISLCFRDFDGRIKALSKALTKSVFCRNADMKTLCDTTCQIRMNCQVFQ